jgi:hypothetical protein
MFTDVLVYILHLVFAHPFAYMVIYIAAVFLFALLSRKGKSKVGSRLLIPGFFFLFFNFFFGHRINASLLQWAGKEGVAKITGSYATSTRYNNHDVSGYHVLIRDAQGRVTETSFRDDDFNVYPNSNKVTYPLPGDEFNVRYLEHFPGAFVIITNDNSPWAVQQRCSRLKSNYASAINKYTFQPGSSDYRQQAIESIKALLQNGCADDSTEERWYRDQIDSISQGKGL